MAFADNLKQLPAIGHLAALELIDTAGNVAATIENKPGKAGSLAVYAALAAKHGSMGCVGCHSSITSLPHADKPKPVNCATCHERVKDVGDQ